MSDQWTIDAEGNLLWSMTPTDARLVALEQQIQSLQLRVDNLTEYVKAMMTADQRLRCKVRRGTGKVRGMENGSAPDD